MGVLETIGNVCGTIWAVGGRLRKIYNDSTDEAQRKADYRATMIRMTIFGIWFVVVIVREKRPDIFFVPVSLLRQLAPSSSQVTGAISDAKAGLRSVMPSASGGALSEA